MMRFKVDEIDNHETSKMFEGILLDLYGGNYRSCIVSLYTLVIFDIIQKMIIYTEDSNDTTLLKILEEIESSVSRDDKYSDIEKSVIGSLFSKNKISKIMNMKITSLRNERNVCAHFGLFYDKLYVPSKEITIDYIDYFYNNLFTKTNNMLSNIKDYVLERIEKYYTSAFYGVDKDRRERIRKDLLLIFDNSLHDNNISQLYSALFNLALIKNDEMSKKYRKYTLYSFKELNKYLSERKLISLLDYSCYKKFQYIHLDDDYYDELKYNPLFKLCHEDLLSVSELKKQNEDFYCLLIDNLKKDYQKLGEYWNIAFDDIIQLSDYLDESDISINDLQFFSPDDIKKSVVSKVCIKSLKNVPVFYGFTNAMQCCEQLRKYYKNFSQDELYEVLQIMNNNDQFYNCHSINDIIEEIKEYCTTIFDIDIDQFPNLSNESISQY